MEESKYNDDIVVEENDNNFGHINIIWNGSLNLPSKENYDEKHVNCNKHINKQKIITDLYNNGQLNPVIDQSKYFKLFRYGYKKINKPNDNNDVTLSISLFMPNKNMQDKNTYPQWIQKYLSQQLKLCIVFNYYFPNGNYRNYLDWYMLEFFKKLKGDSLEIYFTKLVDRFQYNDFEENIDRDNIQRALDLFHAFLKKNDENPFKNGLERFLFYFDSASSCYYENGEIKFREKRGDFFIYKFMHPFIENEGNVSEGHITNGYLGQLIRYLSLKQSVYYYKNKMIKKPSHIVYRDAHASCIAHNDSELIKKLNEIHNEIYFCPVSLGYKSDHHDCVNCKINNRNYVKSMYGGIIQVINSEISNSDLLYLTTIGMAFIINKGGIFSTTTIPLVQHRPNSYIGKNIFHSYEYGIDEYILSSFLSIDHIKKNTIIYNIKKPSDVSLHNFSDDGYFKLIASSVIILLNILAQSSIINYNDEITYYKIFKLIEAVRTRTINTSNPVINLLLSIIPNKYHYFQMTFDNIEHNYVLFYLLKDSGINNLNDLNKKFIKSYLLNDDYFDNIGNYENNKYKYTVFGINCMASIGTNSFLLTCQELYIGNKYYDKIICPPDDYYSGYYNDNPPSLNIGIFRQPSDFTYAVDILNSNKLILPLNKSNYKLDVESKTLHLELIESKNVDNIESGHIKGAVQNLILKYGGDMGEEGMLIAQTACGLNPNGGLNAETQSYILCPLIWKALNYYGYDIKPSWFNELNLNNYDDFVTFNRCVMQLSNIDGWADYAIYILLNDKTNYDDGDNDFFSDTIKTLHLEYSSIIKNINIESDYKKYKMKEYHDDYNPNNFVKFLLF